MSDQKTPGPEVTGPTGASWSQPPETATEPLNWSQPPLVRPRRLYGSTQDIHWQPNPELSARAAADAAEDAAAQRAAAQIPGGAVRHAAAGSVAGRVFSSELRRCPKCGGEIDWDGYCVQCGVKAPSARDHLEEQPAPWVAGVCDRGIRHSRNEDAMALDATPAIGGRAALVVGDGVSMSTDSDRASLAATRAVLAYIAGCSDWGWDLSDLAPGSTTRAVLDQAVQAANQAVLANSDLSDASPASCTLAIGLVSGAQLLSATLGDSRVYWVPDDGSAVLLSTDDSIAQEQIAAGVDREIAESGIHSHVITRWLGRDAPDLAPSLVSLVVDRSGWLLVCSDGLWNYASDPALIGQVLHAVAARRPDGPLALAQELVTWANSQGGDDNITVALARIEPFAEENSEADRDVDLDLDAPTTRTRPVAPRAAG